MSQNQLRPSSSVHELLSLSRGDTVISSGISYAQTHDSATCIARDSELLFAMAERRLSRVERDLRFPARAIRAGFDFTAVSPERFDYVCLGRSLARPRSQLRDWYAARGLQRLRQIFGEPQQRALLVEESSALNSTEDKYVSLSGLPKVR